MARAWVRAIPWRAFGVLRWSGLAARWPVRVVDIKLNDARWPARRGFALFRSSGGALRLGLAPHFVWGRRRR